MSKAGLFQMVAETVRDTHPQPIHGAQFAPKRRNTRPVPKRTAKIKRVGRCDDTSAPF
jgi:hypothetical protein